MEIAGRVERVGRSAAETSAEGGMDGGTRGGGGGGGDGGGGEEGRAQEGRGAQPVAKIVKFHSWVW